MAITKVSLTQVVDNPFQPRTNFDDAALQSLADEMKAEGFWSGALQGRKRNGKVELVFGHRRLRALRLLKADHVDIEILQLTDAQMALRSLEENLQREGLTDLEKSDGIKQAVEVARAELKAAGKNESHAVSTIAARLGFSKQWVSTLCEISSSMPDKIRTQIEAGHITAQTALEAKAWGGDAYMQTLAKQGKRAKETGDVAKPTHVTVKRMKNVVKAAPEPVQEKLKAEIIEGTITTPAKAEQRAKQLASSHVRKAKKEPADLRVVIVGWTHKLKDWEKEMRDVAPYMDYVDEVPTIAEPFRAALRKLIETAKQLL